MCLDKAITQKQKKYFRYKKEDGYSVGYKIYYKNRKKGYVSAPHFGKRQPIGKWIDEQDYRNDKTINSIYYLFTYPRSYPAGFHFYPRKKDAEQEGRHYVWTKVEVKKVYFMKACARGIQDRRPVVVSKHIYIVQD